MGSDGESPLWARRRADDVAVDAVIDALNAAHEAHGLLSDEFCDWL